MTRLGLALALLAFLPQETPPAVDAWGDPLPAGAIARLGSKRFQQGDQITDLSYSADGKKIFTSSWKSIRTWDAADGRLLNRILGGGGDLEVMAVTPDGRTICSTGCNILEVRVWDAETGRRKFLLKPFGDSPNFTGGGNASLAISDDGRRLASLIRDGALRVWDLQKGREIFKKVSVGGDPINYSAGVAISPDGGRVAVASGKNTVVLSVETGQVVLKIEKAGYGRATFSRDGNRIACASQERAGIMIWDIAGAKELSFVEARAGWGRTFAWSPDETTLAWAEYPSGLRIADVKSGAVRHHVPGVVATTFDFSPDSRTLAVGFQSAVLLYDPATGREKLDRPRHGAFPGTIPWDYSPDGRMIAAGGLFPAIRFWDPLTGKELFRIESPGKKLALGFSKDGRVLTTFEVEWAQSATARRFDLVTGRAIATRSHDPKSGYSSYKISPGGRFLVAAKHSSVALIDPFTTEVFREFASGGWSMGWAISADGSRLALGGRTLKIVETENWKELWSEAATGTSTFERVAFTPDGREIAVDAGNRVRFLEASTGKPTREIDTRRRDIDYVALAAVSPDSRTTATYAWESQKVILWDALKEKAPRLFELDETPFMAQFSPDGSTFGVLTADATILVWAMKSPAKAEAAAPDLPALWDQLGAPSIYDARRAAARMAESGGAAVTWLKGRLKVRLEGAPVPDETYSRLVAKLDDEEIGVRDGAMAELSKAGVSAEPALLRAMESDPSATAAAAIMRLLDDIDAKPVVPGDPSRFVLSMLVLEQAGTPEARGLLEELRKSAPTSCERRAAGSALERLAARKKD